MARFFLDVFADSFAQPLQPFWQTRAAGHQQGHGVFDVVIGLGEKGHVAVQADGAGHSLGNDRRTEQVIALSAGVFKQGFVEAHQASP